MLGPSPRDAGVIADIQDWTRRRFRLAPEAAVLVAEIACRVPLCPPLETAVAFWTGDGARHQFRLYKPMAEVRYEDIGWLMITPESHDGVLWECC